MLRRNLLTVCGGLALAAAAVVAGSVHLAGGQDKALVEKKDTPATYKVVKKPFRIELEAKGTLEPEKTTEIVYRRQPALSSPSVGSLIVEKVVAHGSRVSKDDVLLALDTLRIDEVIDQLETERRILDAKVKLVSQEIPILKKSMPVELAEAEQASKQAKEDLKYFLSVGRPETEKQAHFYVKYAAFWLEYVREELRQLEKMYKSKDLTEETEQIILRRQQFWVELAEYDFKRSEVSRDYILNVRLPREEKSLTDNVTKTALALDKAKHTLLPQLHEKQQTLLKLQHDRDKAAGNLEKLRKDRQAMTVTAPMDGIVYYGKFNRGKWTAAADMAGKLRLGGTINTDEVLMTIVNPRPILVHLMIDEKDIYLMKAGLEGKARVPFHPDLRLPAKVTKVSPVPSEPGKYETLVTLELGQDAENLMPGMACSVKFVPYAKKDALVVPKAAIFEEDERSFVWVMIDGNKQKREVRPGRSNGAQTEIVRGLRAGDEIVADATDGKKNQPTAEKGTNP